MKRANLIATTLLAGLLLAGSAFASDKLNHNEIYQLRESGQIMSMEEVLKHARSIQPGQLIEAELEHEKGSYVYELKIIDAEGRLHKLELDAQSGDVLKRNSRD
ncbi:MAG: PepSY domain-containing protein [Chromatiales bacterium]|nr:PepSY domain-containing protein [Gammaproteobacteria bacterium]MBW6477625.1 PepSY domain-containing protein [Chromatiales bacterium]